MKYRPVNQLAVHRAISFRLVEWLIVASFFIFLAVRQHQFVDRYAVNLVFWDQWDFYSPFAGATLWHDFDHQHGPHRMGVGLLLGRLLVRYSHFNTRCDAFAVSFLLMASAMLVIPLARLCGVKSPLALLAIPPLFFNRSQFEQFFNSPDVSHSAMPLLLLMLLCLSLFIRRDTLRLTVVVLLSFLLIFTGFGIFAGVVAITLLAIETIYQARSAGLKGALPSALAAMFILATLGLFFFNYKMEVATVGTHLTGPKPIDYLKHLIAQFRRRRRLCSNAHLRVEHICGSTPIVRRSRTQPFEGRSPANKRCDVLPVRLLSAVQREYRIRPHRTWLA